MSFNATNTEGLSESEYDEGTVLLGNQTEMIPKDRYRVSFGVFYLLGLGGLMPWNFFITANEYWMYKLRDVNATTVPMSNVTDYTNSTVPAGYVFSSPEPQPEVTTLQGLFLNSLAICAMLPNVIFQFLNVLLQKRISQHVRVVTTLCLMILMFIFTEILVKVDTSSWQELFFVITLISVVIINSCSAVFQSSTFGVGACFPQKFSGSLMAGQGIGGVFAALAMIISLAFSSNPTDSAFIFFLTAIAVLILTMIAYFVLINQDFYKYYASGRSHRDDRENAANNTEETYPLAKNNDDSWDNEMGDEKKNEFSINRSSTKSSSSENMKLKSEEKSVPLLTVMKQIWLHMFCIIYTFFITLACFPAVTAKIKSQSSGTSWNDIYFTPVCCFLLFNLSDWVGRTVASYIHIPSATSKWALFICVIARSVFLFLFAFCNYQPRYHTSPLFGRDVYFIVFMTLFGMSNGHLSTLSMQYGPRQVSPENAATAGSLLAFSISVGLLAGAGFSFIVVSLI